MRLILLLFLAWCYFICWAIYGSNLHNFKDDKYRSAIRDMRTYKGIPR